MLRKKIFAAVAVAMLSLSYAQSYQWKDGESGGYHYKYVSGDPTNARFYTLKNGLTVILSPTKKDPRIQAYVAVKAGSKTDPATNTGLAHYLEHMMFKGTDKYGSLDWSKEKPELDKIDALYEQYNHTKDEAARKAIYKKIDSVSGVASKYAIANEYDKMMSEMGAQGTNAFTSFEQTVYTDDVPASSLNKYLTVQGERFRNPILRIFHTELEVVYEEKNRSLDNDRSKVFETMYAELFKNHNYGKQTTIGKVEDLKNPSLVEIRKYLHKYYVPNNMGLIMSGDFDPDVAIKEIDKDFGYMQPHPVERYSFQPEQPITAPIEKTVVGPDAESIAIGYRLPGNKDKDILLAKLVGAILTNGKAGLLDLNLVKKQKLLRAGAYVEPLIDYGVLMINAAPTTGQSLEDVKGLVLNEIENLKKGNFDDDLIPSIVNNMKKERIQETESYNSRAAELMDAFTSELDWKNEVASVDELSKFTKADVMAFANKYFGNNYVAVFKKKGVDSSIQKIDKPAITAVETNASKRSDFLKMVQNIPNTPSQPVFLDFNKDIQKGQIGKAQILYVPNKDNQIFRLRYRYKIGTANDIKMPLAAQYLQFLGTNQKSAEQISKEFYKIASSFSINTGEEYTMVTIEGLQENFGKAVKLYEDLVTNAQPDEAALAALKARMTKARNDAKMNKGAIMQALTSYAMYGPSNKFNYTLSSAQLQGITSAELVSRVKSLNDYAQTIIYYGPESLKDFTADITKLHKVPQTFTTASAPKVFTQVKQDKTQVLFTDYDMVQAETRWVRNTDAYDPKSAAMVAVFNNYFGGGMGSLVFQTIRESKALAYSTYAGYNTPSKKQDRYSLISYVGSQADKFGDAVGAMNELLTNLPALDANLALAKNQVKKDIQTERITQDGIIFDYLRAKDLGLDYDIRKQEYNAVDAITMQDVNSFYKKYISGQPYTYCVVASEKRVPMAQLQKIGDVKKISLEELFGY